jgi:hypothetical protein
MTWEIRNIAVSTSDLASLNFMTSTPHSLSCALDTRILNLLWHSLSNVMNGKVSYSNCIESVTLGLKTTYFCVNSIRSMWHWLCSNHSLSLLYELNGSTHLLCVVLPHPQTVQVTSAKFPAFVGGSPAGQMLSETIDICLNANNMEEILLCMTHLHHHNVTFSKKFKKFL